MVVLTVIVAVVIGGAAIAGFVWVSEQTTGTVAAAERRERTPVFEVNVPSRSTWAGDRVTIELHYQGPQALDSAVVHVPASAIVGSTVEETRLEVGPLVIHDVAKVAVPIEQSGGLPSALRVDCASGEDKWMVTVAISEPGSGAHSSA